ncbi:MAG: hypothetical protein IJC56_04985 [Clostridia bacterium]|nr:hypothetical protein [Clostridia bacterium]
MYRIIKANEKMTSKERVRMALALEKPDRVPIDYSSNMTVNRRLKEGLGLAADAPQDELLELLGVDFRGIGARYIGPSLFPERPGMNVNPEYGYYSRWIENEFGGYDDFCYFPLKDAEPEEIAAFPAPNPDDYDYSGVAAQVKKYKDKAIYVGNAGMPDIINSMGRVMGMEDALVNLQLGDEATLVWVDKKINSELGRLERLIEAIKKAGGEPDFMWMGEDLGTQIAPMISMELFNRVFRPVHQKFIDLAKAYGIPTMIHTCGCSSWSYESFIEMGMGAVDTLQPEAVNMSPAYLKEHFGGRLAFHGCISTAQIATMSAEGVDEVCQKTLETLMPAGGYCFAPTHMIQDNTPVENIVAMYNAAHKYGVY